MGELVAQTYRLIRKSLPWQAQMCPRAFEDLEILRSKHFQKTESNILIGYKNKQGALQKKKFSDERGIAVMFERNETARVRRAEEVSTFESQRTSQKQHPLTLRCFFLAE